MTLQQFFQQNPRVALGFSGGVDSAYLLYEALQCGANVRPYYIKTAFQPRFEYEDALRVAAQLSAEVCVISLDILSEPEVAANLPDRCYHCKRALFSALQKRARADGYPVLIDGTNASDDASDRPGMRALGELSVRSPLRECGLTKPMIRALSKQAGLFTWDKPAYACLATRIPAGATVSEDLLRRVEAAEDLLFGLGFSDFRVRVFHGAARLQLRAEQFQRAVAAKAEIVRLIKPYFETILLDMEERK